MYVFILGQRIAHTVCIFFLRLLARPFLGPAGEADAPPVCFLPWLARSAYDHYCFLQGVSQHLGYLLKLDYQPCLIWKIAWGIGSVLEGTLLFWCLRHFWRGFRSGQGIFLIDPARSGFSVPSDIFRDLWSCFRYFECITAHLVELLSWGSWFSLSFL